MQRAGIELQAAGVELAAEHHAGLAAVVGRELGVAHAVAAAPEAADHHVPLVTQAARIDAVQALEVAGAGGQAQAGLGVAAVLLDEVDGHTRLAAAEHRARAAAQHLHALDGVVQAEELRVLEEGERGQVVQRCAVELEGGVRAVARRREAAHADVGAGLAARGLDEHARHGLQDVGGAGGRGLLDLLLGGRGDGEAGLQLAHAFAARGAGHDDGFEFLHLGRLVGRLGGLLREGGTAQAGGGQGDELGAQATNAGARLGMGHEMSPLLWVPKAGAAVATFDERDFERKCYRCHLGKHQCGDVLTSMTSIAVRADPPHRVVNP